MAAIAALPLFEMGTIGGMELGSFTLGNALSLGGTMLGAAGALSQQSGVLRNEVDKFILRVRAG